MRHSFSEMKSLLNLVQSVFRKSPAPELTMDRKLAEAYNQSRNGSGHDCFCNAPFTNMLFSQSGAIQVCCHNQEFSIGKYPEQSIREIWNSAKANELRNHMRKFDLSHGCGICEADLKIGSFREVRAAHFDRIPKHPEYPTMMEFLVSNQCNLECVMCKGEYSSLIRKNREKLSPLITPYDEKFVNQLEEFIPYLHETRFSGSGEAFSIDLNYHIWEMIIKLNPKCIIMVQTNGTILTDRVKNVLSRGNFQIGVSLDSLNKETFEAIRLNANFDKVMDNIRYFHEYSEAKKTKFDLAMCVMRQNWREMPDFVNFGNSLNAVIKFHKVWAPKEFAIYNLPPAELNEMHRHLSAFTFPENNPCQRNNNAHFMYYISVIKNWAEARWEVQPEVARVKSLPDNELLDYLSGKIRSSIWAMNETEDNKNALFQNCMEKLNTLLDSFKEDKEKKKILEWACSEKAEVLIDAFKKYPVEYLTAQGLSSMHLELEQIFRKQL